MHIMPNSEFDLLEPPSGKMKNFTDRHLTDRTLGHVHTGFSETVWAGSMISCTILIHWWLLMHIMPNSGFDLLEPPSGKLKNFTLRHLTDGTLGYVHTGFSETVRTDSVMSCTILVH